MDGHTTVSVFVEVYKAGGKKEILTQFDSFYIYRERDLPLDQSNMAIYINIGLF